MAEEKNNIDELMENLEQPTVEVGHHRQEFRLTLLNTKKSAMLGAVLLLLPLLFLSGVLFKHYLKLDLSILTSVYEWIGTQDRKYGDSSLLNWIIRLLLLLGPAVALGINLMAVTHIRYEKSRKEIVLAFKMKWLNWALVLLCAGILAVFFLYLLIENAGTL